MWLLVAYFPVNIRSVRVVVKVWVRKISMIDSSIFEIRILCTIDQSVDYVWAQILVQSIVARNFPRIVRNAESNRTIPHEIQSRKANILTGKISTKFTIRSPMCGFSRSPARQSLPGIERVSLNAQTQKRSLESFWHHSLRFYSPKRYPLFQLPKKLTMKIRDGCEMGE